MKKILITLLLASISITGCYQKQTERSSSTLNDINDKVEYLCRTTVDKYELYETSNIYNFIKLDTENGKMTLVQWSLENDKEFEYDLNSLDLRPTNEQDTFIPNRFKLYKTTNIYTFILLDKVNGNCFHVQWNFEKEKRIVKRIY